MVGQGSSNRLASNLEQLVSRVENIYSQRSSELDQVSGVLGNMEKLVEVLNRVEQQRSAEQQLDQRIEQLNRLMQRLSTGDEATANKITAEETLRKIIQGVKVTGKVIDIVAGSLGVMFDTIVMTVKTGDNQGVTRSTGAAGSEPVDLVSVLQPIGSILQGLLGTDTGKGQSDQEEKKEAQ